MIALATPLRDIPQLTPQRLKQIEKYGWETLHDLLHHFPRRYEDRRQFDRFPVTEGETPVCVCGRVAKTVVKRLGGWKKMFEIVVEEDDAHALSSTIHCRWFNVHFVEKMIASGQRIVLFGRPKVRGKNIVIDHPEFEIVENDEEISIHLKRITPIYKATEGLSQRVLRRLIFDLLGTGALDNLLSSLPATLDSMPFGEALRAIHFPEDWPALERARKHLVLSEFFSLQLVVRAKRAETLSRKGQRHAGSGALIARFQKELPFQFTGAQRRSLDEIRADMALEQPMNRLLHGDVGSGKTAVALSAMLLAVESGAQAALMAPTQILAEQHYLNFRRWLDPLGIRVALRTAARKEDAGSLPLFEMASRSRSAGVSPVGSGVPPEPSPPSARYTKRRLPHYEQPHGIYAITFTTRERRFLQPAARTIVLNALKHFHGHRYDLHAACVLSDHVHLIFEPRIKTHDEGGNPVFYTLAELMHSLKSYTAHEINKLDNDSDPVWENEYFDRLMRSDRELEEQFDYIIKNPWSSELVAEGRDYPWIFPAQTDLRDAGQDRRDACAPAATGALAFAESEPQIVVGTHALLYDDALFTKLGLVVIDEQHKFGVLQRARLIEQGIAPDVLVMTATPIPRTLMITAYGDLDVSTLDELPANRGKIKTVARDSSKLPEIALFLRQHLDAGRQAYIVYPLIDESAKTELKAATKEHEKWRELLSPFRCDLLHGRIDATEKEAIMTRFRDGETKVLVATSVIEVGLDVPNATIMLIENAERFGLAQLHQMRGRIGRGVHKSYCILLSSAESDDAILKMKTLEETGDGFKIAEADLLLRGPGDMLGTAQSGLAPLRLGNLITDAKLMQSARQAAWRLFEDDPQLSRPENKRFRDLLAEGRKSVLSQVS